MVGKRLALIVATDEYLDPGLGKLRAPAKDAEALAGALADPELGDFEVDVLRNATSSAISERVETLLAGAARSDLIVLHFSCHGIKDDSGELYLAATNTRPGLLASTAVDASLVNRLMRRSRAQRAVLFLDCCFGGAFERGVVPRAGGVIDVADQFHLQDAEPDGGRGRAVITASNAMEFAFEGTDLANSVASQPSIFTGALVEGLTTGAADRDQDGMVSLSELYDYVFDRVREATPNQTPGKWEFGLQGDLVLAKNPQRVVVPAPLPGDLIALIDHPFPATRLGTIDVLLRLAAGDNLPIAAAAHLTLDRMVTDDSKAVAQAAADAIAKVSLSLSATDVDLGTIGTGADAVAEVSIGGVPLATASRIESSSPAVSVRRVDRTIRIEADASAPGPIDSVVTVSGPAGTASVHVVGIVEGPVRAGRPSTNLLRPVVNPKPISPEVPSGAEPPSAPISAASASPGQSESAATSLALTSDGWLAHRSRSVQRLIERGWRTGHLQTLIGAELGGVGVWWLRLDYTIVANLGARQEQAEVVSTVAMWIAAVIGAGLVLRVAGPAGTRRSVIALLLLYPVFHGLARDSLYPNGTNFVVISLVVAMISLIAASVVRFKRPMPD
jgi:hypothetical protein